MPSAQQCLAIIREAAGGEIPDDVLDELLVELQARVEARRAAGELETLEEAFLNAADEVAGEVAEAAQIERRNRLINIRAQNELLRFAEVMDEQTADPSRAMLARTVGSNVRVPGARQSVDARGNALTTAYLGGLIADLRRQNLLPLLNSRSLDREIAQELAELSKRQGRPGVSGSDQAIAIAEAIDKYRKLSVARENRAGAWIKPLEGYIVRQSHDMHKIRRAGFEAWRDFILPKLDVERTIGSADAEKFLRGAFDGITSGRHIRSNGADETDLALAFKGPANLAKRASQHRVLHFRDADAWFDYNAQFGRGTLMEAVFHDLERAARNTAMMETFGTNPRAMFDGVMDRLQDKHRAEPEKLQKLRAKIHQDRFDEIEGITRIPINATSAAVTAGVMAVQSLSKLGGATLSAFGDLGFKAGALRDSGDNLLSAWAKNLESTLQGMAPGEARVTAELIGVGLEGQIGDLMARFSAVDDTPGNFAQMQRIFFKLNLLAPWTDANKRGIGLMTARDLAMNANRGWGDLPQRELLELYGFDEARWNAARQAVREERDGRQYLMPDAIRDLPDEAFKAIARGKTARAMRLAKDEVETALRSYYVDMADQAVPQPGARERAFLRRGTRPGDPLGIALRLVGQFKAFPVTAATKILGRTARADTTAEFFRNMVNGTADIHGLAHMIVATTVLGYVAQSAKELAKGRTPRDPFSPATWTAAMLQGGGLGLYGDFLFGEYNRFGRSFTASVAGPTLGTADDLLELLARARAGEDTASSALRLVVSNTPFMNLFYTRAALDYLVLYQLQETINPGFLRRMERRIQQENSQTFVLPPSQAIPRGGGGRPFEGVR